jgi:hypothetical protein
VYTLYIMLERRSAVNRRSFLAASTLGAVAIASARIGGMSSGAVRGSSMGDRSFAEYIDLEADRVVSAHARGFQLPSTSSPSASVGALYWVLGLGFVVTSSADITTVVEAAYRSVPEWYTSSSPSMSLGKPLPASVGGQKLGEGAQGWYWDVANPDDVDTIWQAFGIGCVAVWNDRRLLILWGCAVRENPVAQLLKTTTTAFSNWGDAASSLLPALADMPLGMVLVDDVPLDPGWF